MEGSISYVFHDEEDLLPGFYDLKELDYVRVNHSFHEFDLSFHTFSSLGLNELAFLVDFDSDLFIGTFVEADSYNCISSSSNNLTNDVVS